jgi:hypothetical protein
MVIDNEIWEHIPNYDGLYEISNHGRVKSLNYRRTGKEKILKNCITGGKINGYYQVTLHNNGVRTNHKIHHLVALVFLDHATDGTTNVVINHIDHDRLNNRLDNLELVTHRYNMSCHKTDVGVSWVKDKNTWQSLIWIDKSVFLCTSKSKELALDMYEKALNNMHLYNGNAKEFRNALKQL